MYRILSTVKNFKKLAENINVQMALDELIPYPELWDVFTARQSTPGTAHSETKCIPLRAPVVIDAHAVFNDLNAEDTAFVPLLPESTKLFREITKDVEKVGRVMIVALQPDGWIDPHVDEGAYADFYTRWHLVMYSKQGNLFRCGDEHKRFNEGELWWFNHKEEHEVFNDSEYTRIHMIIDVKEK